MTSRGLLTGALVSTTVLALAACSHKKAQVEDTFTPTPTPTVKTATAGAWATYVKTNTADSTKTWKTIAKCPVAPKTEDIVCSIGWFTYGSQIAHFASLMSSAQDPTSADFLGAPPEEIKKLVDDTTNAAKAVETADVARTDACTDGKLNSANCVAAEQNWATTTATYRTTLDSWKTVN